MIKEKINQIIQTLTKLTTSNNLEWKEINNSDELKRAYYRVMSAIGEDGSKFEIDIKYSLINDTWKIEQLPSLTIRSNILPNGHMFVYGGNHPTIELLRNEVKNMYCSDMNPTTEIVEKGLDSIMKGIDLSNYRDNKIENVLLNGNQ